MLLSLVMFVGVFVYGETTALRRDCDLPVGHDLTAEFGDVSLVVRGPGHFLRDMPYAFFRSVEREGALVRLKDGTDKTWWLPSTVITPDGETWFRQHAVPRDLTSEVLPPGHIQFSPEPGTGCIASPSRMYSGATSARWCRLR